MSSDFDIAERNAKIAYVMEREKERSSIHYVYTSEIFLDQEDMERAAVVETKIYDAKVYFVRVYLDGCMIYIPYSSSPVSGDSYLTVLSIVTFIKKQMENQGSILLIDDLLDVANFLLHAHGVDNVEKAKNDMNALINTIKNIGFKRYYFFNAGNYGPKEKEVVGEEPIIDDW